MRLRRATPWWIAAAVLAAALLAAALLAAALLIASMKWSGAAPARSGETQLFTTLPILWSESADIGGLVRGEGVTHWARDTLATQGRITPLDSLGAIAGDAPLLMAQPRPLSPEENVALDRWVRHGGRVLLFADPMLTAPSSYPLGDRRRPQDVVLLSPILSRWGLSLQFDEAQPQGEREAEAFGEALPVNLPGRFAQSVGQSGGKSGGKSGCDLSGDGLGALCRIGRGRVLALADAALLESGGDPLADARRSAALEGLLRQVESP